MLLTLRSVCPRCGADDQIFRSHWRGWIERVLGGVFLMRPVRCDWCHRRYFRPLFYQARRRLRAQRSPEVVVFPQRRAS